MKFKRGLRTVVAHQGDVVVVPPGTVHRFSNGGSELARVRVEVRPALRMEELFETTVALAREGRTDKRGMPHPLDLALFMSAFEAEVRAPLAPVGVTRALMAPCRGWQDAKASTLVIGGRSLERRKSGAIRGDRVHDPSAAPEGRKQTVSDYVIETHEITKHYGEDIAVDHLNLRIRRGEVYGFLGPNGAGKTTTLRMLLGLAKPTSGGALVLGGRPGSSESLARIGALVEAPGLYPFLSGRDNLRVLAKHAGVPRQRIDVVLDKVGLLDRAKDRFCTYSQGMKQRLGVAAALLKDPELLILDEPTNGLDPAGMAEMRAFIRGLGRERRTVLLSSHLMPEVEQVCDRAGVISRGALVKEGTVDELRGGDALRVVAEPQERAGLLIKELAEVEAVVSVGGSLRVTTDPLGAPAINQLLVEAGIAVSELGPDRASLEEVFLELTRYETEDE